jgi:ribosome-associated heat shock protein Hsp15
MSPRRDNRRSDESADDAEDRVRLDKWLWAARFFKTRALAAEAIASGKVEVNEDAVKRARPVRVGDRIRVRLGPYQHHLTVRALSGRRGPAAAAAELYEESAESREARDRLAWQLKHASPRFDYDTGKPGKRDRREMEKRRGR